MHPLALCKVSDTERAEFVRRTEQDCFLMNTSGSVSWESAGSWGKALAPNGYYSQYAAKGVVRTFYGVNVPYVAPVLAFSKDEHYKVCDERWLFGGVREVVIWITWVCGCCVDYV